MKYAVLRSPAPVRNGRLTSCRLCHGRGFSFIELITVVALIALVTSAAAPATSSLFQRHREMVLRENLLTIRTAIGLFPHNLYDDDADGEVDEDPRGDANLDGFPGIRGVDDDGDGLIDEDWARRTPWIAYGVPNPDYDWSVRRDDDEDGIVDEEAFPSDMNDLTMRVALLGRRIPIDPTLNMASWDTVVLADLDDGDRLANNDFDWYFDSDSSGDFTVGENPIILSADEVFQPATDIVLFGVAPNEGDIMVRLVDEDPRNALDDDGDGRVDEDPPDMIDVRSINTAHSLHLTPYNEW